VCVYREKQEGGDTARCARVHVRVCVCARACACATSLGITEHARLDLHRSASRIWSVRERVRGRERETPRKGERGAGGAQAQATKKTERQTDTLFNMEGSWSSMPSSPAKSAGLFCFFLLQKKCKRVACTPPLCLRRALLLATGLLLLAGVLFTGLLYHITVYLSDGVRRDIVDARG